MTDSDLDVALLLADVADEVTMSCWRRSASVEWKVDETLVSEIDRRAEHVMRGVLSRLRPDDAILGEELGGSASRADERRWILDPLDHTADYLIGSMEFATLIALCVGGRTCGGGDLRARDE